MNFTPEEKLTILNRLPALELSYEPKQHKKVYSPIYYIIPKGPKALVWYTYWKDQNVCLLIRLNEKGDYSDVQMLTSVFSDQLALGTIIYGTSFIHQSGNNTHQSVNNTHQSGNNTQQTVKKNKHYFTCEQLYYYKGLAVDKKPYMDRLNLLLAMFTDQVEQIAFTANSLVIGMPVMTDTYEEAVSQLEKLPYKTYGIAIPRIKTTQGYTQRPIQAPSQLVAHQVPSAPLPLPDRKTYNNINNVNNINNINNTISKTFFTVKADLAADNYQLYTSENTLYDTALVPTYKCSVLLNALFRNIKENANLDLLEESDDEEEFENTQIDKFVDLEKAVIMECVYSKRFKKWQPLKTAPPNSKIISAKELMQFNYKK